MTEDIALHQSIIAEIATCNRRIARAIEANLYVARLEEVRPKITAKTEEAFYDGFHSILRVYPNNYKEAVQALLEIAATFGRYSIYKYGESSSISYHFSHNIIARFYFLESASCHFVKVGEEETVQTIPIYTFQCDGKNIEMPVEKGVSNAATRNMEHTR